MSASLSLWVGFTVIVLTILILDLGVFHRHAHEVSRKEAGLWCLLWVSLALLFDGWIYYAHGPEPALEFLAGYLIEESLSVDNIFIFLLIFSYFSVPRIYQHRVLFWGIIGVLLMRGIFIALGATLLHHFHWVMYIFGAFLIFTGIKMLLSEDTETDPGNNPAVKLLRRFMPVTDAYEGQHFFVRKNGKWFATPLFVVLITVESMDLIFAVDSIPAVFAVTKDPFIVYTSNVFAVLGLRALYFLIAGVLDLFVYLRYGLGVVLSFVGVKMALVDVYQIPIGLSLGVIAIVLTITIVASLLFPPKKTASNGSAQPEEDVSKEAV